MRRHDLDAIRNLGNQHDIGAAGDTSGDRDMAGIAAHYFEHHDAIVARRCRLQPVERLGCDRDRGVVAD